MSATVPRTPYQRTHAFADRQRMSSHLRQKYTDCVPIIFESAVYSVEQTPSPTTTTHHGHSNSSGGGSSSAAYGRAESNTAGSSACTTPPPPCSKGQGSPNNNTNNNNNNNNNMNSTTNGATSSSSRRSAACDHEGGWWTRLTAGFPGSTDGSIVSNGNASNGSGATPSRRPAHDALKMALPARRSLVEVILTLRSRLGLEPHQALFLSVADSGVLAPSNALLRQLDEKYRDNDGFLYIGYSLENTFG